MSAFFKVLEAIQSKSQNGHAIANTKNKISLAAAKRKIETMLKEIK
jgi:hypothetical protein